MKLSNRQRRLLNLLLDRKEGATAGELAEKVQTSTRTVHRELMELETLLAAHGLSLVKKTGIGIALAESGGDLDKFREELRKSDTSEFSAEERKGWMLCRLLEEAEPVKLFALASDVRAAIPTVSRDLDELEPLLAQNGLHLVRKRGYGVEIRGPERAKRNLIVWMAEEYLDASDFYGSLREHADRWPFAGRLLELAGKPWFLAVERSLWKAGEDWIRKLQEPEYTRLLLRLSVAVARMKRGHPAERPPRKAAGRRRNADETVKRIFDALGLEWREPEAAHMHSLIEDAKASAAETSVSFLLDASGLELAEKTLGLIRRVGERIGLPLDQDRSLLDGLVRHLGPALERLARGEVPRNPLLAQIQKDYERLFAAVREGMDALWQDVPIPAEEIGYVAMHFGAAIERWQMAPKHVRALLVCTSGIGSSKLLAVRITKEIPQIEIIGNYSWYEASRVPQDQYDFIISTVDLPIEPERYIKLSPLLTREETDKLRGYIRRLPGDPKPTAPEVPEEERGAWERLKRMNRSLNEMVVVLERFRVYSLNVPVSAEEGALKAALSAMLAKLRPGKAVADEAKVAEQLMERERQGSVLLPETQLAFFHVRSEWVRAPVLALFRLQSPLRTTPAAEAKQAFLMLAPAGASEETLEVLSEISALLLDPEAGRLLREGDEDAIRAFFSKQLETYINTKPEWREPS